MASAWVQFRDKAEAIIGVAWNFFVPIAAIASVSFGFPPGIAAALKVIPTIMGEVEKLLPAPGSGPAKKAQVLGITKIIMDALDTQLTGGAATSYSKLKPLIEATIDSSITTINLVAPAIIANDPVAPGPPTIGSGINAPVDAP